MQERLGLTNPPRHINDGEPSKQPQMFRVYGAWKGEPSGHPIVFRRDKKDVIYECAKIVASKGVDIAFYVGQVYVPFQAVHKLVSDPEYWRTLTRC